MRAERGAQDLRDVSHGPTKRHPGRDPLHAAYLAALAAIGHAAWDATHYLRDKVVSRSLTEFCFVLDLGLGIALPLTAWNVLPQ